MYSRLFESRNIVTTSLEEASGIRADYLASVPHQPVRRFNYLKIDYGLVFTSS